MLKDVQGIIYINKKQWIMD